MSDKKPRFAPKNAQKLAETHRGLFRARVRRLNPLRLAPCRAGRFYFHQAPHDRHRRRDYPEKKLPTGYTRRGASLGADTSFRTPRH